ncbi:MAG: hypothetical protein ABSD48_08285, partial [Armatimonadota bacterium]
AAEAPATAQPNPAPEPAAAAPPGDRTYMPDQIRSTSAQTFLERMLRGEPGYHDWAPMWALSSKIKESAGAERREMLSLVVATMKDISRPVYQRWQCCYVISSAEAEEGIPDLSDVLLHGDSEIVRGVAAEALASFAGNAAAHDALVQAARVETSADVRATISRHLGSEMPAAPASSAPRAASESSGAAAADSGPGDATYTPEQIQQTSAEIFLDRLLHREQGYHTFAAMYALTEKAKEDRAKSKRDVLSLVTQAMLDTRRPILQRYQCCYVLSDSGDERAIPDLIRVLVHDDSETMRGVAAEALAKFPESARAHAALLQAARRVTAGRAACPGR